MYKIITRLTMLGTLMWSAAATSAIVEYNDLASWDAASAVADTDLTVVTWNNYIISGGCCTSWDGTDGVNDDVTFTNLANNNPPIIVAGDVDFGNGAVGLGSGNVLFGGPSGIRVDLPALSLGFALDLRGYNLASTIFEITLNTGEGFTKTVVNPAGGFFGLISDTTISSVTFAATLGSDLLIMDNFWVATEAADIDPGPVPAPGGLVLIVGLLGLALMRKFA